MFGERESESPRVPSPWDPFLPSPPNGSVSPPHLSALHNGIPKLVPEVEEVNICVLSAWPTKTYIVLPG